MKHELSKSTFMRGLNCTKSLYLNKHKPKLKDKTSDQQQSIFQRGTEVGELAQQLHPGGIDLTPVSFYNFEPSIIATREAIARGESVIYEAVFQYDGVLAAMDILIKTKKGYSALEVKSSTSVKDIFLQDIALQTYVIENSGLKLDDVSLIYINNKFIKDGPIDITKLFNTESVKDRIQKLKARVPNQIKKLKKILKMKSAPRTKIGLQCNDPYPCDFLGHCWKKVPEYSVFDINNLNKKKRFELYHNGYVLLEQIPEKYEMGSNQKLQVSAEVNKTVTIDSKAIKGFLDKLNYPVYHLDFETFGLAIPVIDSSKPFQQIVFQYSLHKEDTPTSEASHSEFLGAAGGVDPRPALIEKMIEDCGEKGDILVWNIGFEGKKLEELAQFSPAHSDQLNAIKTRLKDLMVPFQSRAYYTPAMKGSYSIKNVLPAIVPDFERAYKELDIQEGVTASLVFSQMMNGSFKGDPVKTRKGLIEYCKLDTLAMVKILDKLYTL